MTNNKPCMHKINAAFVKQKTNANKHVLLKITFRYNKPNICSARIYHCKNNTISSLSQKKTLPHKLEQRSLETYCGNNPLSRTIAYVFNTVAITMHLHVAVCTSGSAKITHTKIGLFDHIFEKLLYKNTYILYLKVCALLYKY